MALVPFLGIYVSSILLIAFFMMWLGKYSVWKTLPIAIGVPVVAYIVFERYFQIAAAEGAGRILARTCSLRGRRTHARSATSGQRRHETRSGAEVRWKKSPI